MMVEGLSFDAVLLAGGRSTRFGSDKAFLDWRGEPLFQRQLKSLRQLSPKCLWLSCNRDQVFKNLPADVETIEDEDRDLGPAGGLRTVFRKSSADWILVLGVDLPLMEGAFLESLIHPDKGVVPRTKFWEPLSAWYPRVAMLELLDAAVEKRELKMQRLLDAAAEAGLIQSRTVSDAESLLFTNLNSAQDIPALNADRFDEEITLHRYRVGENLREDVDYVAAEDPLELRVNGRNVSVMMRTPGHDEELAIGFLVTEGVIENVDEIESIGHLSDLDRESLGNTLEVILKTEPDLESLTRHVFTSSSCGVCGKTTIDSVFQQFSPIEPVAPFSGELLLAIPDQLREAQSTFDRTGGLHASALFSRDGKLQILREDVGRHNALDKVIGAGLRDGLPFREMVLLVSGRISFELMQKSLAVGIPLVAGISAPSSLAVNLAKESGQTLVGFLRGKGFNLYSGLIE